MTKLSDAQKVELLKNHVKPTEDLKTNTKYRRFRKKWLEKYPWIVYSFAAEGAFCLPCALFAPSKHERGKLVVTPFKSWQKFTTTAEKHAQLNYHRHAVVEASDYLQRREVPNGTVSSQLSKKLSDNVKRNRQIVKCVIEALIFCGKQCIAIRGDSESLADENVNPGNFLSVLKLVARHNEVLASHLSQPAMKNATMISPRIQNEILEIIAQHYIVRDLAEEVRKAKYYSILADEVTSSNTEVLALCLRFVDTKSQIREEFLCFTKVERITGEVLAESIMSTLESKGLELKNIRGQGYDGASNMSCARGVQGRIKEKSPLAVYMHLTVMY